MKTILTITSFIFLPLVIAFSQGNIPKCSSNIFLEEELLKDPLLNSRIQKIEQEITHSLAIEALSPRTKDSIVIPVVVHILYNNFAENLTSNQIQSQIDALNRDFNKQNTDVIYTPSVYKGLVADCNIHFALANRDIDGNEVDGIVRLYTANKSWNNFDDIKTPLKGGSAAWNASQYLNIWVGNLGGKAIGVSSFPGMKKEFDGIVVDYTAFGTTGNLSSKFNDGRTCVHEVGHWLNLYHVSGDMPCGNDFVADTPPQKTEHYSKPTFPQYSTCNGIATIDMTMNYMTYVDDDHMYMFTNGQKKRMWALFDKGGFRESLKYSAGWMITDQQTTSKNAYKVAISPNPVSNELTINLTNSDPIVIQIIDLTGKIWYQNETCIPLVRINTHNLATGIYYLKVFKDKSVLNKTFIKV